MDQRGPEQADNGAVLQKWQKWKKSLNSKQAPTRIEKPEDSAQNYARKIIQKLSQVSKKHQQCPISKKKAQQLQSNTCPICFELMVPRYKPMILFPCGHNICRICLLGSNPNVEKMTMKVCPLCREKISNYAENTNLMKLIVAYRDQNAKSMRQEPSQQENRDRKANTIAKLSEHCDILKNERQILTDQFTRLKQSKKVMEEVIDQLIQQRKKSRKQYDTIEEEYRLIQKHLSAKEEQLQQKKDRLNRLAQREKMIASSLAPLKQKKQKMQLQMAEKIISKN